MKNYVIYKITNPNSHSYIGKSTNWTRRYSSYKGMHCKDQAALYASFLKHGFENHTFEILMQEIPEDQLSVWEKIWIWAEDTFKNGLNLTEGGDGNCNPSIETRKKYSAALKGNTRKKGKKSPNSGNRFNKNKTYEEIYGVEKSEKIKEKLRGNKYGKLLKGRPSTLKGRKITAEHKKNISISTLGAKNPNFQRKWSKEILSNMQKAQICLKILCHQNGKIYFSQREAAKELKLYSGNISKCIHGKAKHTGGFTFERVK